MKNLAVLCMAVAMTSCAVYQPVPEGYAGPIATVKDTGRYVDTWTKGEVFSLMEVDGQAIKDSFAASDKQSRGHGFTLSLELQERRVQARPMTVKLRGSHITGAPIHALTSKAAGTYFTVEGLVSFMPEANKTYLVKGELRQGGSSVWIEEESGKLVTDKVIE